ncbi:hypothetical protein [Couchioplanes caeruleus]|uniref:Fibronectin type-III domain-containing protein n=2 Tax=Couchioplanes caeruleus TaxID=56438 RepID=A0A1K0FN14_9ACTN|nr:hypothetical protein [Couchioplanes caeruleus]OJF14223.1 hypothetical protein BG844_10935 [Couchioplanes caeruleus subsp. caeruleus]ROP31052.1 hypothetical protein EDD30_3939 [Couchioplanes caeruleus]
MKLARLVAVLGMAMVATTLVAPQAASAATHVPGPPMGLMNVRSHVKAAETLVYWKPVAGATNYQVTVSDGTITRLYVVAATQKLNAGGTHQLTVSTPNKCSRYRITVASRDAQGQGTSRYIIEKSLAPTAVIKAKAVRSSDPTKATFTYSPPQWKGYLGGPTGGATQDDKDNPKMSFTSTAELVRVADNKVVSTTTYTSSNWTAPRTQSFTGLDPARAYVLKITNSNKWGTCSNQLGRVLLNPNA